MYKSVSTNKPHTYTYSKRSRRRHSIEATSGGCCAIFDFDFEYDDDNDDDDDDAYGDGLDTEDEVGYDYDDYYDYYDDDELAEQQQLGLQQDDADCSMLGAARAGRSRSKPRSAVVKVKGQRSGSRRTNNNIRSVLINKRHNKYKIARPQTQLEVINESEKSAGSGSDENDSLLVPNGNILMVLVFRVSIGEPRTNCTLDNWLYNIYGPGSCRHGLLQCSARSCK